MQRLMERGAVDELAIETNEKRLYYDIVQLPLVTVE